MASDDEYERLRRQLSPHNPPDENAWIEEQMDNLKHPARDETRSRALLVGGPGNGETVSGEISPAIDTIRRGDDIYTRSRTAEEYFPEFDGAIYLHPSVVVCSHVLRVSPRELDGYANAEKEVVAKLHREADRHPWRGGRVGTPVLDRRDQGNIVFTLRWLTTKPEPADPLYDSADPLDPAAIKAHHARAADGKCATCWGGVAWPCFPFHLAAEIERLHSWADITLLNPHATGWTREQFVADFRAWARIETR